MRVSLILVLMAFSGAGQLHAQGWPSYGGDPGSSKYSPLTQITKDNVGDLEIAWTYRTGEGQGSTDEAGHFGLQVTPILLPDDAGGALVICSAYHRVIALDPATGSVRWEFDPEIERGLRGIHRRDPAGDRHPGCANLYAAGRGRRHHCSRLRGRFQVQAGRSAQRCRARIRCEDRRV